MQQGSKWIMIGSLSAAIAIGAGAFGAHGLRSRLDARSLEIFETGARYHLIHALALVLVGVLVAAGWSRAARAGCFRRRYGGVFRQLICASHQWGQRPRRDHAHRRRCIYRRLAFVGTCCAFACNVVALR